MAGRSARAGWYGTRPMCARDSRRPHNLDLTLPGFPDMLIVPGFRNGLLRVPVTERTWLLAEGDYARWSLGSQPNRTPAADALIAESSC
jgi:hypothetical protein